MTTERITVEAQSPMLGVNIPKMARPAPSAGRATGGAQTSTLARRPANGVNHGSADARRSCAVRNRTIVGLHPRGTGVPLDLARASRSGQRPGVAGLPQPWQGSPMRSDQNRYGAFDPLDPPSAAIRQAADLLVRELLFRGVKPEVHNQPANRAYLAVVPGRYRKLVVEIRGSFYSWEDARAEFGGRSHALWGDHANAARRVIAAARNFR